MKKMLTLFCFCFLFSPFVEAQNVKIGPTAGANAEIQMTPNPDGGDNIITMLKSGEFSRNHWRLIYEKNNLTPPEGPIEFAWEVGLGNIGVNPNFFSIGKYEFNLDFIFTRQGLVMDNQTLYTGLGELTPDAQLHVFHLDNLNDGSNIPATIVGEYPGAIFDYGYLTVDQPTNDLSANIARFRDNGSTQVEINRSASTYQLEVFGEAFTTGMWSTSDRRLKKDIEPMEGALEELKQLNPYAYYFKRNQEKNSYLPEELQFGLVAQELQEIYPNLVRESDQLSETSSSSERTLSVNYIGLIPVLIASMQELDADKEREIDALNEKIASQQQQIDELKSLVQELISERNGETQPATLNRGASLNQNEPNPFYQSTRIGYFLPEDTGTAYLVITSVDGKELRRIRLNKNGSGEVQLEAHTYPAGTYNYSLLVDGRIVDTRRMILTQ